MSTSKIEKTHTETSSDTREGITSFNDFKAENVTLTEPRKKKNAKGEAVFNAILLHNGKPLHIETPWLRTPFGASFFEKEGGKKSYTLSLNSVGPNMDDEDEKLMNEEFFDQLEQLDALFLDYGWKHRASGFFSEVPEVKAVVKALYSRCIKQDKEKQYPRRLNLVLPIARDEDKNLLDTVPGFDIYKDTTEPYEVNHFLELVATINGKPNEEPHLISKGSYCRAILQPRIWFVAGKFGVSWNVRALELKTISRVNIQGKYSFSRPTVEDGSVEGSVKGSVEEASVEDSEDDSEEETPEEEVEESEEEEEEEED